MCKWKHGITLHSTLYSFFYLPSSIARCVLLDPINLFLFFWKLFNVLVVHMVSTITLIHGTNSTKINLDQHKYRTIYHQLLLREVGLYPSSHEFNSSSFTRFVLTAIFCRLKRSFTGINGNSFKEKLAAIMFGMVMDEVILFEFSWKNSIELFKMFLFSRWSMKFSAFVLSVKFFEMYCLSIQDVSSKNLGMLYNNANIVGMGTSRLFKTDFSFGYLQLRYLSIDILTVKKTDPTLPTWAKPIL